MSSHLGPTQTLELLENLKATVRDFAAKEEKLNQEFRSKTAATRHRRDVMTEELASRLAADLAQAESSYLEAKQAAESKYQQRKLRIAAAHRAAVAIVVDLAVAHDLAWTIDVELDAVVVGSVAGRAEIPAVDRHA